MSNTGPFIGKGWKFPPSFGKGGLTTHTVSGNTEVVQAIEILLRTEIGERIMHPDFGCSLQSYAFETLDATMLNEIKGNIQQALIKHERRINIRDITLSAEAKGEHLIVAIAYHIPDTNSRYNHVFPYYLQEAKIQ